MPSLLFFKPFFLGEVDSAFHFMKKALSEQQDVYNISLQNVFETGIYSIEKALEVWEAKCLDFEEPRKGKDGHYFLGRKIKLIRPNSESMCQTFLVRNLILIFK